MATCLLVSRLLIVWTKKIVNYEYFAASNVSLHSTYQHIPLQSFLLSQSDFTNLLLFGLIVVSMKSSHSLFMNILLTYFRLLEAVTIYGLVSVIIILPSALFHLLFPSHFNAELKVWYLILNKPKESDWLWDHEEEGQSFSAYSGQMHNVVDQKKNVIYIKPLGEEISK